MFTKLTISGVSITSTFSDAHGSDTTNVKIDSITFEEEVAPEEVKELINGVASMVKDVITTSKKKNANTNTAKRYHVIKTKDVDVLGNQVYMYYVFDKKYNTYYMKSNTSAVGQGQIISKEFFKKTIQQDRKDLKIIAEYNCNDFRL